MFDCRLIRFSRLFNRHYHTLSLSLLCNHPRIARTTTRAIVSSIRGFLVIMYHYNLLLPLLCVLYCGKSHRHIENKTLKRYERKWIWNHSFSRFLSHANHCYSIVVIVIIGTASLQCPLQYTPPQGRLGLIVECRQIRCHPWWLPVRRAPNSRPVLGPVRIFSDVGCNMWTMKSNCAKSCNQNPRPHVAKTVGV